MPRVNYKGPRAPRYGVGDSRAFVGGSIFTGRHFVEALLVEDGEVIVADGREEVSRSQATGAEVVDLHGRLIVPGLIDAHFHLRESALQDRFVDLHGTRSLPEMLSRVTLASAGGLAEPLLGLGWDSDSWPESRYPTRDDLDRVVPTRPVALWRVCGHVAVVNSAAVESLRLEEDSAPIHGGHWGRDSSGRFNGVLYESALEGIRPLAAAAMRSHPESMRRSLSGMARYGVTAIAGVSADAADVEVSAELDRHSPLAARLRFYIRPDTLPDTGRLRDLLSGSHHALVGMKVVTDGSLGARTAWLSEPYEDSPGQQGGPVVKAEELAGWLTEASRLGLQPALHAIGDRAIFRVLRVLEAHRLATVPRLEHASLAGPHLFSLLDRVRPHLVVQPSFVESDTWLVDRLGPSRARWAYAFRTLQDRGYSMAGSSDAPFDAADPWKGIAAAARARGPLAPGVTAPPESLAPLSALQLYTVGASSTLDEATIGSLEKGANGDFVILNVPRLEDAVALGSGSVQSTWVAGRTTFEAPAPAARG